jgi:MFS family permease
MVTQASPADLDQAGIPVEQHIPLRRNMQFQTLWTGLAASSLGVSVAEVAYPLVILTLTGSPARAGLFAAVLTVGMVVGALPGGQLADRHDRRTIVIIAELVRAIVTGIVAIGLILGWLSLPLLLAAGAVLGAGDAIAGAARLPLVRSVVRPEQLTSALVQDEVRQNGAALAGPPLAGALYAIRALSHAVPFLCTAAAFVFSMLAAVAMKVMPGGPQSAPAGLPAGAGPGRDRQAGESDMLAGLRVLWAAPVLRAALLLITIGNTVGVGLDLAVIVILRQQHVSSGSIGLALGAGAAGGLAGAPLVKVLHRLPPGKLLLGVGLLWIPVFVLLAVPFGPWWVASLMFAGMLGVPALRVLVDVLIFRQTPDEQRGRVVAAVMMVISVGMPLGLAGTGLLLQWLPAQTAMLVLVAVLALGVAYSATKRELWRARWPQ